MIVFKKIRWKNFLSTGNVFTEIDLISDKTNLIVGKNGAGKSTILDALTFSLFGKPFRRINKPMLVNSINEKDCVTEIEFTIGKDEYRVVRGIKPSKFDVYCNKQLWNQESSVIDQQKNFEQNVLKMNYKSFTQIVVLGSSTFVPFMRLPVSSRREIIEDILDIQIFSVMNQTLKEKIKVSNNELRDLEYLIDILSEKYKMQKDFIEENDVKKKADISDKKIKIKSLLDDQKTVLEHIDFLRLEAKELTEKLKTHSNNASNLKKLLKSKGKIENKFSSYKEQHMFFTKNSICPTCTQNISDEIKDNNINSIMNSIKLLKDEFTEIETDIKLHEKREKEFVDLSSQLNKTNSEISVKNNTISSIQSRVNELSEQISSLENIKQDSDSSLEVLKSYESELGRVKNQFSKSKEDLDCLYTAAQLLKDNGIKTRIIKRYLPVMNKLINQYLQNMDFYVNFTLDENFEETIKSRYRDVFSYESFSEGEKARIDISLLLTWRSIAKLKNSVDTNLLILDEIFDGSLDQNGTGELGWILRNFDDNTNVFVISHKEQMADKFDKTITFQKVKNYSVAMEALASSD